MLLSSFDPPFFCQDQVRGRLLLSEVRSNTQVTDGGLIRGPAVPDLEPLSMRRVLHLAPDNA